MATRTRIFSFVFVMMMMSFTVLSGHCSAKIYKVGDSEDRLPRTTSTTLGPRLTIRSSTWEILSSSNTIPTSTTWLIRLQHETRCRDSHGTVFTTSSPQIKLNVHWDRSSMFLSFMTPHVRFLHHHHRLARSFLSERPYKVGDSQGWKVYDSDFYNKWSEEKQFRVGDILLFANEEGNDVSEINGDLEFMTCDPTSPVAVYKTGHDLVRLTELGNYYFITPRSMYWTVPHASGKELWLEPWPDDRSNRSGACLSRPTSHFKTWSS
ncbi:BnaC09g33320D [Brassica napus]|uniref:(rape) hypothetical protein n=2 Tax=Brassica napus TaxID=3708 RepID=A0A078H2P8_BRANA|nr:unnamed protein product [Brassica napus]CDY32885.1 BnaC09g33320D [Brassica napus]